MHWGHVAFCKILIVEYACCTLLFAHLSVPVVYEVENDMIKKIEESEECEKNAQLYSSCRVPVFV